MTAHKQTPQDASQPDDFPVKLSAPARRTLEAAGYVRLAQLAAVSEVEIMQLHGTGPKAVGQLRDALAEKGLSFRSSSV